MGYLWALVEPALTIVTFYVLFTVAKRAPDGMDIWGFVATGVLPYTLFSSCCNRCADAISGNKPLLFYPHVQPLDFVIARTLLEFATYVAVFAVLMFGHALYVQQFSIDSALRTLGGFILAGGFGAALGLLFCGLGQLSRVADRARGPLLRPLFWISGIFFTSESAPDGVRDALLLNPVLHAVEMTRSGWYKNYSGDNVNLPYVLTCILIIGLAGLVLERSVRRRIEPS